MAFCKDFMWGVGGAAAQQDGGAFEGGKGPTIWDKVFTDGHVKHNDDSSVACDHYHRYAEDFKLLKEIGVNTYRFSICPARIYPHDAASVNAEGVRFYKDLVAELRKLDIEPMVTLFHWDLPLWLHDIGGWQNPLSVEWFEKYTRTVVEALSDQVTYWITVNEPSNVVGFGAWGSRPQRDEHTIIRNIMLAHGCSVQTMRKFAKLPPKVGFANATYIVLPVNGKTEAQAYADSMTPACAAVGDTSLWADPMVLGCRPAGCDWLSDEDLRKIAQPLDFFGINTYHAWSSKEFDCEYAGIPRTTMGWPITPDCLYYAPKFVYKRYGLPIVITENGMANVDMVFEDGKVHDPQRSEYIRMHIRSLKRANDEGVPVLGYLCWSFMDNFEWFEGYAKRFGLVYVDYRTQKRTIKDSAYVYREIIESNGETL